MKRFLLLFLLCSAVGFAHEELSQQIRQISTKIRKDPKNATLYLQRAELNRTDSRWKNAEQDYLNARSLAPGMDAVDLGLGLLYYDIRRYEDSRKALDLLLSKHPDQAIALVTRARIFRGQGKLEKAIADYGRSLQAQPDPAVYIERADLLAAKNHTQQALSGLNEGIAALGPVVTLELAAIRLELPMKQYDSAVARVDQIAEQSDRKETWLVKRAEILRMASRNEEAKQNYRDALDAISALPESKKNTTFTRDLENKIRSALEELDRTPIQ